MKKRFSELISRRKTTDGLSFLGRAPEWLPIIQDGKLVGAVIYVMVNDPTTGYGIFIENMLSAANSQLQPKAA